MLLCACVCVCVCVCHNLTGTHGNAGQINYATAKAGVVGLTKSVAKEWGPYGVRCNAIAYGLIDTRLTGAKESGAFIEVRERQCIPRVGCMIDLCMLRCSRSARAQDCTGFCSLHVSQVKHVCVCACVCVYVCVCVCHRLTVRRWL